MAGLNKAMLIGRLGRDPETAMTKNGTPVASFSLATTEKYKEQERTEWHKIIAFGKLAEICAQYLHKGKQVYLEGRIQTREWEDKEGNRRWTTEIIANTMQMIGGTGDGDGRGKKPKPNAEGFGEDVPEDDIPF